MKPASVLPVLWFISTGVDQPASVTLSPLLCLSPPVTKATVELLTEQSSHYQRHARSYVHQSATFLTKHYLTPQTPLKSKQMSCLLGRTLHLNHPVKVLHRDTTGSKSREAITTEVSRGLQCVPPAAPHYYRQRDPRRRLWSLHTCTRKANGSCMACSNRDQPRAGGSEMAQPLLKQPASGLAVPLLCPRQAGVRAITVQRPGGKGA